MTRVAGCLLGALLLVPVPAAVQSRPEAAPAAESAVVRSLNVTVLSTMLADDGIGEWGFAALVDADGYRLLVDTGGRPDTVRQNARELQVDLSTVRDVLLTHNHGDHTSGLLTLRREVMPTAPTALSRVFAGRGILYPRLQPNGARLTQMATTKAGYEQAGGTFTEIDGPVALAPGVWLTGPVRRVHPERNWSGSLRVETPDGVIDDTVAEDTALVVRTADGLVVLTGCGHAGVVNTLEQARRMFPGMPVRTVLGGMHLFEASDAHLAWTAERLKAFGVRQILGAHCTGIEAVFRLRHDIGLPRAACLVGAVGARFDLTDGIRPGRVAR